MPDAPLPVAAPSVSQPLHAVVTSWYAGAQRDLPWRRPGTSAWAVLVSEVMLQQTPVTRVLPVYLDWVRRWPEPADLARDEPGAAVRAWGRLGYPRRALRLHAAAVRIVTRHEGRLPESVAELLELPGVGAYTARAVAAFAFRQHQPVVDTNVRRLVARAVEGRADGPVTRESLSLVADLLPADAEQAAVTSVALMELGALVCTARAPRCAVCPLVTRCGWVLAGSPPVSAPTRRPATYAGSDRQVRGRLLAVLRGESEPVGADALAAAWPEREQQRRALAGLLVDGLVQSLPDGTYCLPSRRQDPGLT